MKTMKTGTRAVLENIDEVDFVKKSMELYNLNVNADEHNITAAREDMKFVIGDQWDQTVKLRRERLNKPALTINRLPAFIAQYIGSWMQTETEIRLAATSDAHKNVADIRQGLIRSIMRTRAAKNALNQANQTNYICGVGNYEICLKEAENDVFARDITFNALEDPFQVIWDRSATEPTGADAQHCHVFDNMTKADFEEAYPDALSNGGWPMDDLAASIMIGHGWEVDEMVRICRFWQMKKKPVTLMLEADSHDVVDVTDWDPTEIALKAMPDQNGDPIVRETMKPYAQCYVMTGSEVLEGPFDYPISRLPVFRVEGWKLMEATVQYRWGFVRNAKDPQRLHNYWRSILAEELQKSPASKWMLDSAAMRNGIADKFRNAHLSGDPVLEWDSEAGGAKPEFIPPPQINAAVLTEAQNSVADIRDVTNRHEASMGQVSNEVSGRAITARQRVSELGDVVYVENMNAAMAEAGRVINELIPIVYDTHRMIKVTGEDNIEEIVEINGDETPDITLGKYDLTYTTGPSYATKRQEAVDTIMTMMNTMPQVGNIVADILVRNMDIPGAKEIEERLALMLPPGMIDVERLSPRFQERYAQQQESQQQQQQQEQQLQLQQLQLSFGKMQAEIEEISARAYKSTAAGDRDAAAVGVEAQEVVIKDEANDIKRAQVASSIDQRSEEIVRAGLEAARDDTREEREAARQAAQTPNPSTDG